MIDSYFPFGLMHRTRTLAECLRCVRSSRVSVSVTALGGKAPRSRPAFATSNSGGNSQKLFPSLVWSGIEFLIFHSLGKGNSGIHAASAGATLGGSAAAAAGGG
jgi:hypothetical protein